MARQETLKPLLAAPGAVAGVRTAGSAHLRKALPPLRELAHKQLLEALSDLLDVRLTDLVLEALASWGELVDEADKTRRTPGLRSAVTLATQKFGASREAVLDVDADGVALMTLPVRLDIELEVQSLVAALKDGCLYQLASGESKVTGTLLLDDVPLPPYTRTLDLTVALRLDPPLRLSAVEQGPIRLPDLPATAPRPVRS